MATIEQKRAVTKAMRASAIHLISSAGIPEDEVLEEMMGEIVMRIAVRVSLSHAADCCNDALRQIREMEMSPPPCHGGKVQ